MINAKCINSLGMGEGKYLEIKNIKIISPLLSKAFITNINCRKNSTL